MVIIIIKYYIRATLASFAILAVLAVISWYDGEPFTEPFIDYSQAETLIPLDSMWEEEPTDTEESIIESKNVSTEAISTITENITTVESVVTTVVTTVITVDEVTTVETSLTEATTSKTAESNGLININTASIEELKQLNGVGDVIAERIVEYAKAIGFKSIDEIKNVKGIGDKKYENIKDKITV